MDNILKHNKKSLILLISISYYITIFGNWRVVCVTQDIKLLILRSLYLSFKYITPEFKKGNLCNIKSL